MAVLALGLLPSSPSSPPPPPPPPLYLHSPFAPSSSLSFHHHHQHQPQQDLQHRHLQQQQQKHLQLRHQSKIMQFSRFPSLTSDSYQQRDDRGQRWVVRATSTTESRRIGEEQMLVFVPPHPLIKHWMSVLRNKQSPTAFFKSALAELGRFLIYEASRDWLSTVSLEVETPCGVATVDFIDPREPVRVVPILRSGLVLVEHVSSVLPATQTYHIGFVRDENTVELSLYLNKLPERFPDGTRVLVADAMLATGGTIVATIDLLKERNVDHKLIRVVAAVAAPPALKQLGEKYPGLRVYTGTIDPTVNEQGYIVPGLGDAGDRSYGT